MQGTPGIVISIAVGTTVLAAITAVFLVKCYLNWKRQQRKHKKQLGSVDGTVQQLVISSQPVDFVPLLIQDQLEEEDDAFENGNYLPSRGISAEELDRLRDATEIKSKEHKIPPPLRRLDTASSILDKPSRKLKKPMETGKRGESLYFDDGDTSESETSTRKKKICISGSPIPQRSSSVHGRPGKRRLTGTFGLLSRRQSGSSRSLSCESLTDEGPDHIPHMRSKVVSIVDTKAPRSKMIKPRRVSTGETPSLDKPVRKTSRTPERRGNVAFKVNYLKEKHALEVHLINATGLPIKHHNFLNTFVRVSLRTPSKHLRRDSKVVKNSCNPIYDEKFVFDSIYLSELQQTHLKLKVMHVNLRVGVTRYEQIGEAAVSLCDEDVKRGESVYRDLFERAKKSQCAGELFVSVCHQATSSRLKVVNMKLKDLPKSIKSPSITVELTHKNEILQQIPVKLKRKSLTVDEEFSFEVATNTSCPLENFGVQFTVFHHDFIRGSEIVGQVRLAMDAPLQSEMKHWTAVVLSPHKPIAEWHKLHAPLQ